MRKVAILPMQSELPTSKRRPQGSLIVNVWLGADGAFQLYEDESRGFAYQESAYQWTPLTDTSSSDDCHTLKIESAEGNDFSSTLASRMAKKCAWVAIRQAGIMTQAREA
jgi:hypothetical protein